MSEKIITLVDPSGLEVIGVDHSGHLIENSDSIEIDRGAITDLLNHGWVLKRVAESSNAYEDSDLSPELAHLKKLSRELLDPELYVRLVEMLGVAIVVVNQQGSIIVFNQQAELLFGYRRIEVMGRAVEILVPDAVRSQHQDHRGKFDEEPRARPMGLDLPLTARHKSGRGIPVEINLVPIPTTNGVCTAAVVWRKR